MCNDALTIAVFAAEQLLSDMSVMEVRFVLTQFGPIVEIETFNYDE
jgi:hypothetical protein